MRSYRFTLVWLFVLFASVIAVAELKSGGAGRRAQNRPANPPASEIVRMDTTAGAAQPLATKPGPATVDRKSDLAGFEAAANRNTELQTSLVWSFGGKQQRGWSLYTPLIANLTGSDANAIEGAFAMRLSLWQKQNSIEPNGVLDGDTWSRMISAFQSRRMKYHSSTPGELVTIPTSDCYDPARPEELRKAEPETYAAYKRMIAAAAGDKSLGLQVAGKDQLAAGERFLKVVSAFRSQEYQDQLRKQSPGSGRAGLAVNSPHSTGRALDLYVGGDPVDTKDSNRALQTETPVYRWLVKNAGRFGFQPYFYEPWHWEYVGVDSNAATRDGATQ
jgi:D-alanyl-D-alanine carboxypeptidase